MGPTRQRAGRDRLIEMGEKGVPVAERIFGEGSYLRPNFIQPYRCKNVLIEGVKIVRSPMWEVHPVLSQNVIVRDLTIESHGPNNDGVDPESCRDVLIEGCLFDTGDDCIAIKSGRNADGRRLNVPSENIIVRKCTMKDGHGGVVIGSEISGGCRNVFVEDCKMDSPNLDRALRFKSNADARRPPRERLHAQRRDRPGEGGRPHHRPALRGGGQGELPAHGAQREPRERHQQRQPAGPLRPRLSRRHHRRPALQRQSLLGSRGGRGAVGSGVGDLPQRQHRAGEEAAIGQLGVGSGGASGDSSTSSPCGASGACNALGD